MIVQSGSSQGENPGGVDKVSDSSGPLNNRLPTGLRGIGAGERSPPLGIEARLQGPRA